MSPYGFSDYRSYLKALCALETSQRGFRARLSRAAGCQASYFSQMIQGRVHLTEDQIIGIAFDLDLAPDETEFLLLLLRHEKAGTKKLKEYIEKQIQRSKLEYQNLKNRVVAKGTVPMHEVLGVYFSSWIYSAVHLLTSSEETQTVEAISSRLHLPATKTKETLEFLQSSHFVEKKGLRWIYKSGAIHIEKCSPFQPAVQMTRRELATRSIALNSGDAVHFSSLFTIDEADFHKIRELLSKYVEASHKQIERSGTSRLACMCLDLFEVV
jgi:uncharacterized protein (TIGR02147 family)